MVTNCPDSITETVAIGASSGTVTWTEPTATDNSGVTPTVTSTHQPGQTFPAGTSQVQYTFTDESGNSAVCLFQVTGKQKHEAETFVLISLHVE